MQFIFALYNDVQQGVDVGSRGFDDNHWIQILPLILLSVVVTYHILHILFDLIKYRIKNGLTNGIWNFIGKGKGNTRRKKIAYAIYRGCYYLQPISFLVTCIYVSLYWTGQHTYDDGFRW